MSNRPKIGDFATEHEYTRAVNRHCAQCGQRMEEVTRNAGFDSFTGAALQVTYLKCSANGFGHAYFALETAEASDAARS